MIAPEELKQKIIVELLPPLIGNADEYPSGLAEKEIEEFLSYGRETIEAFSTDEYIISDFKNDNHKLYATVSSMVFQASWLYATKWHFERECMETGLFPCQISMLGTWEEFRILLQGMRFSQRQYVQLFDAIFSKWSALTQTYWDTPITGEYMQKALEGLFIVGAHIPYMFMNI